MMLNKFWESMGSELAKRWVQHIFGPVFLFWAGGLGMYLLQNGWADTWQTLSALEASQQAGLLLAALLLLIGSSLLMEQLRFSILRLLEGYWPHPFHRLARGLSQRKAERMKKIHEQANELIRVRENTDSFSNLDARRLAQLEMRIHYIPADPVDLLPTALGNILRAGETAPRHKYGLDALACWSRLWLLLPQTTRHDLSAARLALMQHVELWAWGLLFLVWLVFSPWALLIGLLVLIVAYALALQAAMGYADLIESAFDLHRWALYEAIRWPLPDESGAREVRDGRALTEFLWRGTGDPVPFSPRGKE